MIKVSKELEALERIGNKLATGGAVINQTFDFEIIKQALTELEWLQDKEEMYYKALCKLEEASNMSEVRKILNEVLT